MNYLAGYCYIQIVMMRHLYGSIFKIEIYPLADFNESMKAYIEMTKAAEKMMPSPPREMAGVR